MDQVNTVLTVADRASVQAQYEALPYPHRDPEDERKRLVVPCLSTLALYVHQCRQGRAPEWSAFRVLDAGGGTGDSTLFLAEQLKLVGAEVVYMDFCKASREVCEARARVRKLTNIRFETLSLLDQPSLSKLGSFDLIISSGVLHHLPDPDVGLAHLRALLKPEGAMGIMVYAAARRVLIESVRKVVLPLIPSTLPLHERARLVRKVLATLPPSHLFNHTLHRPSFGGLDVDHELVDLFLHSQERSYSAAELFDWVGKVGLHIVEPLGLVGYAPHYNPANHLADAELANLAQNLDGPSRYALAEQICCTIDRHMFYATTQPQVGPARVAADAIPYLLADHLQEVARLQTMVGGRQTGTLTIQKPNITAQCGIFPQTAALLAAWDGNRTLAELLQHAGGGQGLGAAMALFEALDGAGMLAVRHKDCRDDPVLRVVRDRAW